MRAQLLDAPRPSDLLEVVRRLTLLQIDPTTAIAPSADLVAGSRLGSAYDSAQAKRALENLASATDWPPWTAACSSSTRTSAR